MSRSWMILPFLTLITWPATANDTTEADLATLERCVAEAGSDQQRCIGNIADTCQDQPGGSSTAGIDDCLGQERAAWDMILNQNYRSAIAAAKEQDASYLEQAMQTGAAKSLLKAQRAWIAFRDAECDRRFEMYKDGTIRTNIASSCLLEMTARRALELTTEN